MNSGKSPAVGFIFITLLIDVIGFGIIIPVLPKLLAEMNHISINEASKYGGYLLFSFAFAQFLFSPVMGNLSDQYGRRPVLLFSLLGFGIDYLILAFASNYSWLLAGRIIAGITGASFTTAAAYIADVSTPENRSKNYGMIGAAFGLGFVIGPLMGGLLGQLSLRAPFYAAALLSFLNLCYGYFVLPESLSKELRRPFSWKRANPLGTLRQLGRYKQIAWLLVAYFMLYLGSHAVQSTWNYFTMYHFQWSEAMVGFSLAFVGVLAGVVQAGLAQRAANNLGIGRSVYLGFAMYTIGMFLFAFANASWMMYVFLIPYCFGGIAMPNLQSLMVGKVPANEQGELQGGLTSLMSVTTIIGPILMTNIFYTFTRSDAPIVFPGAAFFMGGIFMLISFAITFYLLKNYDPQNESPGI